ncbi:hypothetical protein JOF56_000085 [Kibdelosporangium banguiense]|uniref:FtsX extracellular domain-containing protein n=1 Tax=Kibdelosporangium banguiense TaxID=1365924 RepID=A0ABS4T6F5_9PSEU|nr:hypothetical protein [Kibdelosporangium banguiense]MBP2319700.1 hypothetical protein [Kibdelosporangium banguiense]
MKPRLLLTVIAVAALVIAGAAVIVLAANQPPQRPLTQYDSSYPKDSMSGPECPNIVTMYFKTDEAMTRAASRVEGDGRFYNTVQETKAQGYERFKKIFKDQPELVALAKPETLPASIMFSVDGSLSRSAVLSELRSTYASADVPDPCEFASRVPRPTATRPTR